MNEYSISVIIPAYNAEKYLGEAIRSVLAQTLSAHEIIVIDDGSTDTTRQITENFGGVIKYYYQENLGISAARNKGVNLASGNLFAFMDADDLWLPEKLALQTQILKGNPACDAVFTYVENFYTSEITPSEKVRLAFVNEQNKGKYAGAMLISRRAFLKAGFFDVNWRTLEFVEWWSRADDAGTSSIIIPDLLVRRRVHGKNNSLLTTHSDYLKLLRIILERRKKNA